MKRLGIVAVGLALVVVVLVGGFMALDRTVLHWYVPESTDLGPLTRKVERLEDQLTNVRQDMKELSTENKAESESGRLIPVSPHEVNLGLRVQRLANVLALTLVNDNLVPDANTGHPQVKACYDWLLSAWVNETTGERLPETGSSADCGLTRVEE